MQIVSIEVNLYEMPDLIFMKNIINISPAESALRVVKVVQELRNPLQKHVYLNILKISPPKTESFQIKILYFHISAQNIDCEYSLEPPHRGGSNEYPQSMFLSRYKKNNVYPCKPQFYYIKVGFKGVRSI